MDRVASKSTGRGADGVGCGRGAPEPRNPQLPLLSQMVGNLNTLAPPPCLGGPEPQGPYLSCPWAAGPRAPHRRPLLVSSSGSGTPFRQKKRKKKKKTSVLFSLSCFSRRLLVGVVLPLWAHSLLPPGGLLTGVLVRLPAVWGRRGAHAPRPDTHRSVPRGVEGPRGWPSGS